MTLRTRWMLLLVVVISVPACWGSGSEPPATAPSVAPTEPSPPAAESDVARVTLGRRLFANGKIVEVIGGAERVVARWPSRSAP